jgi:hypothetical protein
MIPDTPIHSVDNWGEFAEDGQTLNVIATLADGMQLHLSLCPGKPLGLGPVNNHANHMYVLARLSIDMKLRASFS